ncbi:MAG: EAL domain-containing protein [Myxococcota bacterium]
MNLSSRWEVGAAWSLRRGEAGDSRRGSDAEAARRCLAAAVTAGGLRHHVGLASSALVPSLLDAVERLPRDVRRTLCLDLCPSAIDGAHRASHRAIARLRAAAVRIGLAHVTLDSGSLEAMASLTPDVVHVDLGRLGRGAPRRWSLRTVASLQRIAVALGSEVIAVGVVDDDEATRLLSLGIRHARGPGLEPARRVSIPRPTIPPS